MKKNLIGMIYAYVVSLICVCLLIVFLGKGLYGLVQIFFPDVTLASWEWKRVATLESYKNDVENPKIQCEQGYRDVNVRRVKYTDKEWNEKWENEKKVLILGEKRIGRESIIYMIIYMIISIPIYIVQDRKSVV
jgi:hypothetical protein